MRGPLENMSQVYSWGLTLAKAYEPAVNGLSRYNLRSPGWQRRGAGLV
jgi:hypothetical protein